MTANAAAESTWNPFTMIHCVLHSGHNARRFGLILMALAIVYGISAPAVYAQDTDISTPYEFVDETQAIGVFGGYAATDRGVLELGPGSAPVLGLRYGLRVSGPFVLEARVAYLPSQRMVLDTAAANDFPESDLSIILLDAALRFNLTGPRTFHGILPYVLVGGGGAIEIQDDGERFNDELGTEVAYDFGTTFAGKLGVGAEWFATRRWTVRVDVQDVFWEIQAPAAFLEADPESDIPAEEFVQNFFFLLGVSYRL